ncbi:MAG: response regulator [Ruminococcus sp.]|nr:response regulator [Ruminococcus sp.]
MNVLIIDDDPVDCEHARLALEEIGVKCDIAHSGEEAIEIVKLQHIRKQSYSLILVDLKMPDMNGIETTKEIRKLIAHETSIIIITAYKWDDIQKEALDADVDSFITKPLVANNVIEEFRLAMLKRTNTNKNNKKANLKGRRILLAEDVEINAEIMAMVLQILEISVDTAENGRKAVDMFIESNPGYYNAILMDIRMPEMDGLEATSLIRDLERPNAKTIPIIALTANAFDEDVQRSMQAGMNAHLTKPIDKNSLFTTLENLI